jgi:hypothetical protein
MKTSKYFNGSMDLPKDLPNEIIEPNKQSIVPTFCIDEDMVNYIYLLKEREFVNNKQHVFKIGFTSRDILARTNGYPKGSKIITVLPVSGNPEKKLIDEMKRKFIHRTDIGNEYFEGEFTEIIKTMFKVVY